MTADDVVHSIMNRVINDPQSKQKASVAPSVVKAEAVDKFTVKITTDKPTAPLLSFLCDRLIVTSKAAFDKYGRDAADKDHMMGGGPYQLKELIPGNGWCCRNGRIIPMPRKILARRTKSSTASCASPSSVSRLY